MTVLLAIGAIPSDGSNPYIIMGADTRRIGANLELEKVAVENNFQKVHKIHDKLVGISGQFETDFLSNFLNFIEDNDYPINDLTEHCYSYIEQYITGSPVANLKIAVFIGSIVDTIPTLGMIDVKKESIENAIYQIQPVTDKVIYGSNFPTQDKDIMDEFANKLSEGLDFKSVRISVNECLKKAATRRPDVCNRNMTLKILGN